MEVIKTKKDVVKLVGVTASTFIVGSVINRLVSIPNYFITPTTFQKTTTIVGSYIIGGVITEVFYDIQVKQINRLLDFVAEVKNDKKVKSH